MNMFDDRLYIKLKEQYKLLESPIIDNSPMVNSKLFQIKDMKNDYDEVVNFKGFDIGIEKGKIITNCDIIIDNKVIGHFDFEIETINNKDFATIKFISIEKSYRSKGIAITLYRWLIGKYAGIISDKSLSKVRGKGSFYIWKKLEKEFFIYTVDWQKYENYKVFTPKKIERIDNYVKNGKIYTRLLATERNILSEGLIQNQRDYLVSNNIIKYPKVGMFKIYDLEKTNTTGKMYLSTQKKPNKSILKFISLLEDVTNKILERGLKRQDVSIIISDYDENPGRYFKRKGIVEISKKLLEYDYEFISSVIIHEWSHQVFVNLPKDSQEILKNWYEKNIYNKTFKMIYNKEPEDTISLNDEQINTIIKIYNQKQNEGENIQQILSHVSQEISKSFEDNFADVRSGLIERKLKQLFEKEKRNIKKELKVFLKIDFKNSLQVFLKSLRFPSTRSFEMKSRNRDKIMDIAYSDGLIPTRNASVSVDELFADTIVSYVKGKEINKGLDSILRSIL